MFHYQWVFLVLLSIAEVFGDFALENFANTGSITSLGTGLFGYAGVIIFLIKSLTGSTILYVNSVWDGISSLVESFAAFILLGERFSDPKQYLGVLFVAIGLWFLKSDTSYKVSKI